MEQIFDTKQLTAGFLIDKIDTGELGLSYIQRHFLWKDEKIRDMFDSMFHGYPLGYLMLWECPESEGNRVIGVGTKSYTYPKEVIIDGQQRLTSLYAVMKGKKIRDDKFNEREIIISFNPLDSKFGVKVKRRGAEWIYNISDLFTSSSASQFIRKFLANLEEHKKKFGEKLTEEDREKAEINIEAVFNIKQYVFSVVTIKAQADAKAVSQIFIRINSSGTSLTQNDFMFTLLSIYSGESRKEIEEFCKQSRIPSRGQATSYNNIGIEIAPSDVIHTVIAYAFYRVHLGRAYNLLSGLDFNKREINIELREEKLAKFREKLANVLNVNNWHEFLKAVMNAGYISKSFMPLSSRTMAYSYAMFLITKYKFNYPDFMNMHLTSLWFFYVALTSFYADGSETELEYHFSLVDRCNTLGDFRQLIFSQITSGFTDDYFRVTLASASEAKDNVLRAYVASLNVLGIEPLFSRSTVPLSKFFEPGSDSTRKALERHHLFPKSFLKKSGYSSKQINQTANYAFIDWNINAKILDEDPAVYYPEICRGMTHDEILQMEDDNALPHGWEFMDYEDFLIERRKLMAQIIKRAYEILKNKV